jgi:hypothetical protein
VRGPSVASGRPAAAEHPNTGSERKRRWILFAETHIKRFFSGQRGLRSGPFEGHSHPLPRAHPCVRGTDVASPYNMHPALVGRGTVAPRVKHQVVPEGTLGQERDRPARNKRRRTPRPLRLRAVLNAKKKKKSRPEPGNFKRARGHSMCSTMVVAVGGWRLAAVGGWQLATGGWWRLVVVGGGWWLAVGGWRQLAVVGSWRLVAAGGWRRLVAVGGWRLVAVGS